MSVLAMAMAPMVSMSSIGEEDGSVTITIKLKRETVLYDMLSSAYNYARNECWDEDEEGTHD